MQHRSALEDITLESLNCAQRDVSQPDKRQSLELLHHPNGALVNPTGDNPWSSYIALDGTLTDPTRDNLWNSYIAPDGTLVDPPVYIAAPSY